MANEMTKERYETLKVAQIREFAKSRGIKGASSMKKAELIEAMVLKDEQERAMELARNTGMPPLKFEEESAKPAEEKREKPAEKKAEKPVGEKREKPAEKKSEKPAKEERAKPAGEKREKPAEKKRRKPAKEEHAKAAEEKPVK
ncbi:MAG: Rho termination factor N-terminal domain-containing protein, partial [Lachnospiraceae bacterium]|nr:Rho termination factor N-terminal domain-containing protein [Lachnospiraceae bacterium]